MQSRLFIALPVPEAIKQSLTHYSEAFPGSDLRWVMPSNYHMTVSFFGEQEAGLIPQITYVMRKVAGDTPAFQLRFKAISPAPPGKKPSMLWAEYETNHAFSTLVSEIEEGLRKILTFSDKREGQIPIPHITLVRFRTWTPAALPQITLDSVSATSIVLYKSEHTGEGRIYSPLEECQLSEPLRP